MADPVTPQPISVPDLRRVPEADYRTGFDSLIRTLAQEEREHTPEIAPRPLADPKLSQAEYEKRYREWRYEYSRRGPIVRSEGI